MKNVMAITKALSDANRVRILMMLKTGELCVCQLIEMLGLAPSTVSKHMSILQQAELVISRKDGRWIYYSREVSTKAVSSAVAWLDENLSDDPTIQQDEQRLGGVRCQPKEELCERYH